MWQTIPPEIDDGLIVTASNVFQTGEFQNAWFIRVVNHTDEDAQARVYAVCVDAQS